MADEEGSWSLIESDPGVFTSLIGDFGVKGVQVEEVFELDRLTDLQPVHGLIFLFKYQAEKGPPAGSVHPDLFFAKQVINNACATQAILSILLNSPTLDLGQTLQEFYSFTKDLPPDMRGLAISNSDKIRSVHNSFARADPFFTERNDDDTSDSEAFHFISYVHFEGCIYELDGLQASPINHGSCKPEEWTKRVIPVIESRISRYANSEIRFNLMAVVKSRLDVYSEQLAEAESLLKLDPTSAILLEQVESLKHLRASEVQKRERWKKENVRRRHNFVGMIFELLRQLASKKLLPS